MRSVDVLLQPTPALKGTHAVVAGHHILIVVLPLHVLAQPVFGEEDQKAVVTLGSLELVSMKFHMFIHREGGAERSATNLTNQILDVIKLILMKQVLVHLKSWFSGESQGTDVTLETLLRGMDCSFKFHLD